MCGEMVLGLLNQAQCIVVVVVVVVVVVIRYLGYSHPLSFFYLHMHHGMVAQLYIPEGRRYCPGMPGAGALDRVRSNVLAGGPV